ncbi:hypothetical protein CC86DRAFT_385043 [Ophiobolus disseminans]|uniref:Uncharacterized protein n=1 Tax=Ophiobolus disseminans TaxID=1469910 RepID=A0A6A6ZPS4_9PLEO|nr:hypothetical protein CC86DRAFT_385043 [Ophiobolus disseminans]
MYVAVGPAAYTANTLVALGMQAPKHIPEKFLGITSVPVGDLFKAFGVVAVIFCWLVAFWFCALATVSVLVSAKESHFTLNYWAFILPNVGLVVALVQISKAFDSHIMKGVCSGATIILVILWIFVAVVNVRGVLEKQVLWPGMDEDMGDVKGHEHDLSKEEDIRMIESKKGMCEYTLRCRLMHHSVPHSPSHKLLVAETIKSSSIASLKHSSHDQHQCAHPTTHSPKIPYPDSLHATGITAFRSAAAARAAHEAASATGTRFHQKLTKEHEKKERGRKQIALWVANVIERHDRIARRGATFDRDSMPWDATI